ncbi:FeoA domain-containing protein [Mangrovimonas sp. AS39]|uniref:metal-dependent transcriptional regulator n=1 Tax=Mangrovimonas futianensis TaxID=2895523 RepID=UPI001E4B8D3C|nr:FeoA domain-containing protein [Mangrovimonas futianensis]MCF1190223.1 FeoA domain-containing protein [Mangrovimonas futianensis]MCF1194024.1 FeoA domain-containing protein [Mangrovimonas futianensis]
MNISQPLYNLILFVLLAGLLYFLFRPTKGWFWIIQNSVRTDQKTITEDILKQMYTWENQGVDIFKEDLIKSLKYSDGTLEDVLETMEKSMLITQTEDILELTPSGRNYAIKIVRVHRLWEKYLAEKTGFEKSEWHHRAEKMEHRLSHEETNMLATQLGNPMYDPHGDPIPTHEGDVLDIEGESLADLDVDTVGKIVHIEDEPDVIYRQILAENIHIGSQIRVVENSKQRVLFYSEGEEFVLAPEVAKNITIQVFETEVVFEEDAVRLSSLKKGEEAEIIGISKEFRGDGRRRLLDLGFVKGTPIKIDLVSPLSNPKAYLVKGTTIALREDQAAKILIKKR